MDRDQKYYLQQYQTSLGCGLMLFVLLASLAGMWSTGVTSLLTWLIMPILLAVGGLLLGLLIAKWLATPYTQQDIDMKAHSQTRQLVGDSCVSCQKRINKILEGTFCPTCGSALHHGCKQSKPDSTELRCPHCGSCPS